MPTTPGEPSLEERVATLERRVDELQEQIASNAPAQPQEHPVARIAGILKDHPDLDEVKANMRAYQAQVDAESD